MPKFRLDLWNKSFYKETAFGRMLSGRNKTGQSFGVAKDTILSVAGLGQIKKISDATGKIVSPVEAEEIGKSVEELNLSPRIILIIRGGTFALLGVLFVTQVLGWDEILKLVELFNEIMPG